MESSRNSRSAKIYSSGCHHHHTHPHNPMSSPSYSYYYYSSTPNSSSSTFASSTTTSFSTRSSPSFHHQHHHHHHSQRSTSPSRVNLIGSGPSYAKAPSVRFSVDPRSISPQSRSLAAFSSSPRHRQIHQHSHHHHATHHHEHHHQHHPQQRRTCMCSPTTHPGSFRCSLHKNPGFQSPPHTVSAPSNRLNARRSAMTNSLVRIGTVEGELVKRALAALIRPSSHQQRRRAAFQPRPSRLSIMSKAGYSDDDLSL